MKIFERPRSKGDCKKRKMLGRLLEFIHLKKGKKMHLYYFEEKKPTREVVISLGNL